MGKGELILVAGTNCPPENEEAFLKWYDEEHIPILFNAKGFNEVVRYRLAIESDEYPNYLTVYKLDNQKAFDEFLTSPAAAAGGEDTKKGLEKFKFDLTWNARYVVEKVWKK